MMPPGSALLMKKLRFHSALYRSASMSTSIDCTGPSPWYGSSGLGIRVRSTSSTWSGTFSPSGPV
jgi:hypothetical protein